MVLIDKPGGTINNGVALTCGVFGIGTESEFEQVILKDDITFCIRNIHTQSECVIIGHTQRILRMCTRFHVRLQLL